MFLWRESKKYLCRKEEGKNIFGRVEEIRFLKRDIRRERVEINERRQKEFVERCKVNFNKKNNAVVIAQGIIIVLGI